MLSISSLRKGKRRLLFLLCLLTSIDTFADDTVLTLDVAQSGTLNALIGDERKLTVTQLTLTGDLNGDDILCLREMSGRDFDGNATTGTLATLDIVGASIVAGGSAYFKQYIEYKTEGNVIGVNMFRNTNLQSVVLPANVTTIKSNAFDGCARLKQVTLPEVQLTIDDAAFQGCTSLTFFDFANTTAIGGLCLSGCTNIEKVILPETLTKIGYMAFANLSALKEIQCYAKTVPEAGYQAFQNIDFANCKLYVPEGCANAYGLADQWKNFVNIIESGEIKPMTADVETPGTLADIIGEGKYTIKDLTVTGDINGTDVCFLREMGGRDDTGLTTVGSLERLDLSGANIVEGGDPYYYSYSEGLRTSDDVMSNYFFMGCNFKTIVLPKSVKIIEGGALTQLKQLEGDIVVPEGVTRIGEYAFSDCPLLESVLLPSTLVDGTGIGFYKDAIGANAFYGCHSIRKMDIPENVTKIKDNTFMDCLELAEVSIPSTVTVVSSSAFKNCTKLQKICVARETPPSVGYEAFGGVDKATCVLHVPIGTKSVYETADGWSEFLNIVEDLPTTIGDTDIKANTEITVGDGAITITSPEGIAATVCDTSGRTIAKTVCAGKTIIPLPAGIYIVKVGEGSKKIMVR